METESEPEVGRRWDGEILLNWLLDSVCVINATELI